MFDAGRAIVKRDSGWTQVRISSANYETSAVLVSLGVGGWVVASGGGGGDAVSVDGVAAVHMHHATRGLAT